VLIRRAEPVAICFKSKEKFMNKFLAAMSAIAFASMASPALAGACPMGQEGANPLEGAATMPSDVTDSVLSMVDLGPEIGVTGRSLRLRMLVLQPGGVVPMHSHNDRPALIFTASGTVTEYSSRCKVPIVHNAGEVSTETNGVTHWWRNTGNTVAVLYSSDVHNDEAESRNAMQ
jgi:quercetin dioxygenase-like cupin family protein